MFTGIIEKTGHVKKVKKEKDTHRLVISVRDISESAKIGDSISVNGACLTLVARKNNLFSFDITEETFKGTTLRFLKVNDIVNVEQALKATSRLEGHFVLGHIDSAEKLKAIKKGTHPYIDVTISSDDKKYVVEKGSIAIDGISLTVGRIYNDRIRIFLIPHTYQNTNIAHKKSGDWVNVEFDVLGKYVLKNAQAGKKNRRPVTSELLKNAGFV